MNRARLFWLVLCVAALSVACGPKKSTDAAKGANGEETSAAPLSPEQIQEEIREAIAASDPTARGNKLEELVDRLPKGSPAYEFVARALIQTWAITGDLERMEAAADRITIQEDVEGAELLNAMAYAYAEAGTKLTEARMQVTSALNILDRMEKQEWRGVDATDWLAEIDRRRGYYLDTLAWIDVKRGHLPEGIAVLREAVKRADLAAIRFHLGYALQQNGDTEGAAREFARAAALGGEDSEKAEKALAAIEGVDHEKLLEQARSDIADSARKRILARAIDEDIPEFTLTDWDGNPAGSEAMDPNAVYIIDFWASWCGPCKEEFPILQEVHDKYRGNPRVKFLMVSVDQELDDAKEFIQDGKYTMPVAHEGKGNVALKFDVEGLPTLFIINDNRIRFRHVGYNPELDSILPTQIDALLDGSVGPTKAEVP